MISSSGLSASIGCMATRSGAPSIMAATSASASAMRGSLPLSPDSGKGAGFRDSHQSSEIMRGSLAIIRCSMVVPVRARPTITRGSRISSSRISGKRSKWLSVSETVHQESHHARSLHRTPHLRELGLLLHRSKQPLHRLPEGVVAEVVEPRLLASLGQDRLRVEADRPFGHSVLRTSAATSHRSFSIGVAVDCSRGGDAGPQTARARRPTRASSGSGPAWTSCPDLIYSSVHGNSSQFGHG